MELKEETTIELLINPIKVEIVKSASQVHHDMGNMLNEISYIAKEKGQNEAARKEMISKILDDYKDKLEYLNFLINLTN